MKYYDLRDKKYHNIQSEQNDRVQFPDGTIADLYERAKHGERVSVENLTLSEQFDKSVIEKNLLYLELRYLVVHNDDPARIEEIKLILNPPENEENLNGNDTY